MRDLFKWWWMQSSENSVENESKKSRSWRKPRRLGPLCVALGLVCVGLMGTVGPVQAQQMKLRFKGAIESNLFFGLLNDNISVPVTLANNNVGTKIIKEFNNAGKLLNFRNSNSLSLEILAKLGDNMKGQAQVQIRNLNFSQAFASTDLENYNSLFPVSVRLFEAYMEMYDLLGFITLTLGQQRIAWGTTTVFNPTDVLNPFNLENPIDFQQRMPVPAIKVNLRFGELANLTLVNIPMFTPAVLPISLFREVTTIDTSSLVPNWLKLGSITSNERIEQPEFSAQNMQGAARLSFSIDPVNFSVSYAYVRLFIPVPKKVPIVKIDDKDALELLQCNAVKKNPVGEGCVINPSAQDVVLVYPRVHVIGADFAMAKWGFDFRVEAAVYIPVERIEAEMTIRNNPNDPDPTKVSTVNPLTGAPLKTISFKEEVFFKLVAEIEYTIPGGLHFIFQYLYGFFNEQNWDQLHHYWMLTLRKTFFHEKLEVRLVGGFELDLTPRSGEAQDGKEPGYAFLTNLEFIWKPFDGSQIVLGGIVSRGILGTTFRLFQPLAQAYLRAKMEFK